MNTSEQNYFLTLLSLQNTRVEVALASTGKRLVGTVANTMFDSFLLDCDGHPTVIRFTDVLFLNEV